MFLFAILPTPAPAQARWVVDLSAGHTTYDLITARVGATSLIAGARLVDAGPAWLYAYGGVPFDTAGILWTAGGFGRRIASSYDDFRFGGDLAVHLLGYRDTQVEATGAGATLEALPFIGTRAGPLTLELRSGLLQHTDWFDGESSTRRVHETGLRARLDAATAALQLEARYLRAPEADYPFVGASGETVYGPLLVWASAGRWLTDTIPTLSYGVGSALRLTPAWEVRASLQREANHPLYWNLPRSSWSVGISRSLGPRAPPQPGPLAVPQADGSILLRISADEAAPTPSVLGEFTCWQPVEMQREAEFWVARFTLEPGVYRYGFLDAEGAWFLPASAVHRVDDGMGGTSAVLVVP